MKHRVIISSLAVCALLFAVQTASAAVSAEQAAKLKTTLTPLGATRAGSKDGLIPPWTGGYTTPPPGYKTGAPRPDPFANERPLFTVTKENMSKYANLLSQGEKALLTKIPGFRMEVFPCHRTAAAPQYVYDNTFKNATRAVTYHNGLSVKDAYGGTPFPIPQNGYEAMWNHLLAWSGEAIDYDFRDFLVDANGQREMPCHGYVYQQYPYYFKSGQLKGFDGTFWDVMVVNLGPPFKAGQRFLFRDPVDMYDKGRSAWQYLVGQRRVRRAPALSYDTPNQVNGGVNNFDEVYVFNGALDRYNWKLLGKKELIVPYNEERLFKGTVDETIQNGMLSPDYMRWEVHRVWVVDATLAPGKRMTEPHRRFYLDEDTWKAVLATAWDAGGNLWKVEMDLPLPVPELPGVLSNAYATYDLIAHTFLAEAYLCGSSAVYKVTQRRPESFYSPAGLAAFGQR